MFFHSWAALGRVLLVGPLAYVALVLLLRVSGKRTLTKLNAFDLVVTVSLGSTLATMAEQLGVAPRRRARAVRARRAAVRDHLVVGSLRALPTAGQGRADAAGPSGLHPGRCDAQAA